MEEEGLLAETEEDSLSDPSPEVDSGAAKPGEVGEEVARLPLPTPSAPAQNATPLAGEQEQQLISPDTDTDIIMPATDPEKELLDAMKAARALADAQDDNPALIRDTR